MFALALALAVAPSPPVPDAVVAATPAAQARDPEYFYRCELTRNSTAGFGMATARVSEGGAVISGWFVLGSPAGSSGLSLSRHWDLPQREVRAGLSYGYDRRERRVSFVLEDDAGTRIVTTDPVRGRDGTFFQSLSWDELRQAASRSGNLHIKAIGRRGTVLAEYVISLAQLDSADREAARLSGDFAAMIADYRNQCGSTRDEIVVAP